MQRCTLCAVAVSALVLASAAAWCQTLPLQAWDFESGDLQGWTVISGNLGKQPSANDDDRWQGNFAKQGKYFIGTYEGASDGATGELRSPTFTIQGDALSLLVGGGRDAAKTFIALVLVDGDREVRRAAGDNAEAMARVRWDLKPYRGSEAYLRIVDTATGGWGHINVDDIRELTAEQAAEEERLEQERAAARARAQEERYQQWRKQALAPATKATVYSGDRLQNCWMPLGGVGAGNVSLFGDGSLRQWQVLNQVNRRATVDGTFFAVTAQVEGSQRAARVLQSAAIADLPNVSATEFVGEFPLATVRYPDPALPVQVQLQAFTPFCPLDARDSGLPTVVFLLTARNTNPRPAQVAFLASLQNFVGWDGFSAIKGVQNTGFGGNTNAVQQYPDAVALSLRNPTVPADDKRFGSLALSCLDPSASYTAAWTEPASLWADFVSDGRLEGPAESPATSAGTTVNGALAWRCTLAPGETTTVPFVLAWHFPNRHADYRQDLAKYRLGNMYNNWFADAPAAARYVAEHFARLKGDTLRFHDTFYDSNLPYWLLDAMSSQASTLTSQTCLWIEDGSFHGFEGCSASVGCCPMNCTHVWNYEQTLAHLFPELERKMRHTDLVVQQTPDGAIHHRTVLPLDLPRGSGPFADGHLSTVSKAYREHRMSADYSWLREYWPRIQRAMDWAIATYDDDGDGCVQSAQPNTYDCTIYGNNTFLGAQWLAALRAAEEMARLVGDAASADRYHAIFTKGSAKMDAELWNGEWWIQSVDMDKYPKHEYVTGCHSDQLLGQWWADINGLGDLLPPEHVRTALGSIFRNNFMKGFEGFRQSPRTFASPDEMGLLVCTWPKGGRPATPTLYSDEVWTGLEYELAALMMRWGLPDEGLQLVKAARDRYNGSRRSPWNEIECGDHYARAMSSFSVLLAAEGYNYNGPAGVLRFSPTLQPDNIRAFFPAAEGWGTFSQVRRGRTQTNRIQLAHGSLRLNTLELSLPATAQKPAVTCRLKGAALPMTSVLDSNALRLTLPPAMLLAAGEELTVGVSW
jgi:non-lysosomal glucosylceramidase